MGAVPCACSATAFTMCCSRAKICGRYSCSTSRSSRRQRVGVSASASARQPSPYGTSPKSLPLIIENADNGHTFRPMASENPDCLPQPPLMCPANISNPPKPFTQFPSSAKTTQPNFRQNTSVTGASVPAISSPCHLTLLSSRRAQAYSRGCPCGLGALACAKPHVASASPPRPSCRHKPQP